MYDLLTAHPLVGGAFESWMFSPRHGIGGVFAPEQWDPEHLAKTAEGVDRPFGLHQMVTRDEVVGQVRELVSTWLSRRLEPGHRFLVEKTPSHLIGMDTISEVFPDARFIHVIRDGRDVAVSVQAAAESWNPGLGSRGGSFGAAARSWRSTVDAIAEAGARRPERYLEVTYEALHGDPGPVVSRMLEFCEIPEDDGRPEELIRTSRFSTHEKRGQDSFRRSGRVGDWRASMGPLDALRFERAAGELLIRLGYEQEPGWWRRQLRPKRFRGGQ